MVDPSPDSFVGQQVANFHIDELVKDGTLSRIYRGRDVIQRRPVAVKIIDARQEEDSFYLERFLREARGMMSAWWHHHITRVYYAAKRDGRYITVMEYVDGPNLRDVLAQYAEAGELIRVDDVLRIGRAVAEALMYAHQHGVMHRDVKPSNVLMCKDGRILLTDFGLAPPIASQDDDNPVYGSPEYISPEQIMSPDTLDKKADLYSLAAMLYELLVGRPPFVGATNDEILQKHLQTNPTAPSVLNPQLAREVDAVLLKALAKSPDGRYPNGTDLIDDLEEALGASIEMLSQGGEMPPLPAVIQEDGEVMPTVSQVSVVDRIASQLEMNEEPASQKRPMWDRRRINFLGCWAIFILLATLLVAGGISAWPIVSTLWQRLPEVVDVTPTETFSTETAVPIPTVISATVIVMVTMPLPTATETPLPTETATPEPTATETPLPATHTPAPTITPLPTATSAFTGPPVRFHYDRYSFYVVNPAEEPIEVVNFAFQALAGDEPIGQGFRGRDWSSIYSVLETGVCDAIELMDAPSWLRPSECVDYNVTITPPITYNAFWVASGEVSAFRVYWSGQEIGSCRIVTGLCELRLP